MAEVTKNESQEEEIKFSEEIPEAVQKHREGKALFKNELQIASDEDDILAGLSDEVPDKVQDPIDAPVIQREREIGAINPTLDVTQPIPEPILNLGGGIPTPPINVPTDKQVRSDQNQDWQKKQDYATTKLGEKVSGSSPGNPAVTTMSTKEEKERLKMSVDTAIFVYSKIKMWLGEFFVTSPAKMRSMEKAKKIKLDWAVDFDEATGEPFTFRQFIVETNKKIIKACETSEEFKNKVRPLLEAEFAKRGWVLSYQQNLMFVVGQDLFETGQRLFMVQKHMAEYTKKVQGEVKDFFVQGGMSERELYNYQHTKVYVPYKQPVEFVQPVVEQQRPTENTATPPASEQEDKKNNAEVADSNSTTSAAVKNDEDVFTPPPPPQTKD